MLLRYLIHNDRVRHAYIFPVMARCEIFKNGYDKSNVFIVTECR